MEKHLFVLFALMFWAGAAFAQAPIDSSGTLKTPELLPSLSDKLKIEATPRRFGLPHQKQTDVAPGAETLPDSPSQVTPIYSNMPMAKIQKKREAMPSAKADETATQYHLLKKRYKVLPVPSAPDSTGQ
ncbi:hypothetical protein ACFSC6_14920 [Rufibacter sediminis]|uniref:Uncharacterized protein n=1 Tax=Rufibacter sediminis TaxID=2762756 RepID=A0ABR6VXF1_9BACT|nr:hypothetical protein [Rufibacter sediminis]MBC3541326.1 hypothetical protein [Rufibacter sediminis]